ncbi:aldehyde dehydrogenase family protein [Pseudonocardia nigra]|uniref:aldehyde dehydrogenase family protein n=1 Tax=Pseudonocardia nigra TaxID=1921578 RepID=UPI0027E2C783|nr:aldehyde dehydrogenase family protein [Pseudonocardia nigra]
MLTTTEPPPDEICVGGIWRRGGGAVLSPYDPATGERITTVTGADTTDVDEAAAAAEHAAADPRWRGLLPHERARVLHRIADAVEREAATLAALQTRDTGKTLTETAALVASAVGTFRYTAAALETSDDALTTPRGPHLTMTVQEPYGVVGAITPWNSPIASDAQKLAPALAAGNAVLLKPAAWTPLVALALGRIVTQVLDAAGLPPGLLSVLPGDGRTVGDAVVRDPRVGMVSFTGGTDTGRGIAAIAAQKLMPVSLELGGKSPTIVFPDADLEHTVAGVLYGIFSSSGQSCVAGSRVFVAREIYDEVLDALDSATRALRVGPGTDPRTQVAPLVHHRHRDAVAAMVEQARADGARVVCGGRVPNDPDLAGGAYYLPTILDGLGPDAAICRQEVFGPVAVVLPFDGEDDLVAQANSTVYGLAAGIWTADHRRAWRVARRVLAGTVWINTYKQFSIATPFGGMGESGLGTEKGRPGIRTYSRTRSVFWGMAEEPLAWAGWSGGGR